MRTILPILILLSLLSTGCHRGASQNKTAVSNDNKTLATTKVRWGVTGGHDIDSASVLFAVVVCPNIMFEKAICTLAENRSPHAGMRLFAERRIVDGDTINDPFIQEIIKKGILVIEELEPEQQTELDALTTCTQNFDHTFLKMLIRHYQRSLTFYESISPTLNDVEFKRYAVHECVVKQDQLEQAQRLLNQIE